MRRAAATILALLLALPLVARADDVRPVSMDVRETAPGRYEVRFQTPMRGRARLRARPRLPEGAKLLSGSYDRQIAGDSSIERALIFTRTKHGADKVARHLEQGGVRSAALHGPLEA